VVALFNIQQLPECMERKQTNPPKLFAFRRKNEKIFRLEICRFLEGLFSIDV